jgi:hypothetical protein
MKIIRTHLFKDDFQKLPDNIKRGAEKALRMLLNDPHHLYKRFLDHIKTRLSSLV